MMGTYQAQHEKQEEPQTYQQQYLTESCDMLERQMIAELERRQDEFEGVVRKHQIVVEMQNLAEGSRRMRAFLERQHYAMLSQQHGFQPHDAQHDILLLGAMIEFNNRLAYQMDLLEARLGGTAFPAIGTTPANNQAPSSTLEQPQHHSPSSGAVVPVVAVSASLPSNVVASSATTSPDPLLSKGCDQNVDGMPWEATTEE